jgi:hypothetical protein
MDPRVREDDGVRRKQPGVRPRSWWRRFAPYLLIIPYIGTLWVSSYASLRPEIWGIPFFYWYQFLWIGIGAAITIAVYLSEESDVPRRQGGTS